MNPSDYTSDSICRSLGLAGFVDPDWPVGTLRVLFMPSFSPEVCITVCGSNQLNVVAASEMIWHQSPPCAVATYRESVVVDSKCIAEVVKKYKIAVEAHQRPEGRMVCIADGMQIQCVYKDEDGLLEFKDHPYREQSESFVRELLQNVWDATVQVGVKNRLADCGRYVSHTLPKTELPPQPPLYRIAVIGGLDARAEVLDNIERQVH